MSYNIRNSIRNAAKIEMQYEKHARCIDFYVERLDEDPRFAACAYSTLVGAVRAAAREIGRYDSDNDRVLSA